MYFNFKKGRCEMSKTVYAGKLIRRKNKKPFFIIIKKELKDVKIFK